MGTSSIKKFRLGELFCGPGGLAVGATTARIENEEYSKQELNEYLKLLQENFYTNGVINCPIIENEMIIDHVDLIQKSEEKLLKNTRVKNSDFEKSQNLCPS